MNNNTPVVCGIDVCAGSIVPWICAAYPQNVKSYFKQEKQTQDDKFYLIRPEISRFLTYLADNGVEIVAMEPTGGHYSWFWSVILQRHGFELLWVGHAEVAYFRRHNRLPDKNDLADAMALALLAIANLNNRSFFLHFELGPVERLRELYLQLQSLNRISGPAATRTRQQLAREFPEAARCRSEPGRDGLSPLFAFLARRDRNLKRQSPYWSKKYALSVAHDYGVTISDFTRKMANIHCDLSLWETEIEAEIIQLLKHPQFEDYLRVFRLFGFGLRPTALLLSHIYPMSRFETLGQFKRRLGMVKEQYASGDINFQKRSSGSKICRSVLYYWCFNRIAPKLARPQSWVGKKLGDYYDSQQALFNDPDYIREHSLRQHKQKLLTELSGDLVGLLDKFELDNSEFQLEVLSLLNAKLKSQKTETKPTQNKRGFGKLVISRTCVRAVKILYKELKRASASKP